MERILRDKEIFKIIPFDYGQNVLLYPIRHHSPACAYHLEKVIEHYQPDCILVEGPENANERIEDLVNEDTVLPVAFYYFYKDSKKLVSEDGKSYKCYYPFLNTSPEYVALKRGWEQGIPCEFIDLPYGEILIHTQKEKGLRKEGEFSSYSDERYLCQGEVYKSLCEKTNVRNFEEFWEKYFELEGIYLDTRDYVARMLSYCYLARKNTSKKQLEEEGTIVRENYMAGKIKEAAEKYQKVLVVTGGFHTPGLQERLQENKKMKKIRLHKFSKDIQDAFLLGYSFQSADALNGYASGIQKPQFYDLVWQKIKTESKNPIKCYEETCLEFLLKTAKEANKKGLLITMSDISQAVSMMNGLAMLRDKRVSGLYELYDSTRSCFVKGECNGTNELPLTILGKLTTGDKIGRLCQTAVKSPLLEDFEQLCKRYGIKLDNITAKEIELSVFAKEKHREISRFFYRLRFLGVDFAKLLKGHDVKKNQDASRIREIWKYRHGMNCDATLVDRTVYGGTIEEACRAYVLEQMEKVEKTNQAAELLVDCFLMGIQGMERFYEKIEDGIIHDGDFFSIAKALYHFRTLLALKELYKEETGRIAVFLREAYQKALILLPSMINVNEEQAFLCCTNCKLLYQIVLEDASGMEQLREVFEVMCESTKKQPLVYGSVLGLLYGIDGRYQKQVKDAFFGYLSGDVVFRRQGAMFLRGLFYTARDILLVGDEFLLMITQLIEKYDMNEFMELLPELKLAFSYFLPSEIDEIAEKIAGIYGCEEGSIRRFLDVEQDLYALGIGLDEEIWSKIN